MWFLPEIIESTPQCPGNAKYGNNNIFSCRGLHSKFNELQAVRAYRQWRMLLAATPGDLVSVSVSVFASASVCIRKV